jgi:hypothetical protein
MLAILQPFYCDQADSEQGQFPALDELLGSLHRPVSRLEGALMSAGKQRASRFSTVRFGRVCMVCVVCLWCDWVVQATHLAAVVSRSNQLHV